MDRARINNLCQAAITISRLIMLSIMPPDAWLLNPLHSGISLPLLLTSPHIVPSRSTASQNTLQQLVPWRNR
eukprot:scaffold281843_cov24-Prasinocladus_malaysianus.AAC.1